MNAVPVVEVAERAGVGLDGQVRPSEDVVVVLPNAVVLLDGATMLRPGLPSGGWYASRLAGQLAGRLTGFPDMDLADLAAGSIRAVARDNGLVPGESPSSTVALVRWDAKKSRDWCWRTVRSSRSPGTGRRCWPTIGSPKSHGAAAGTGRGYGTVPATARSTWTRCAPRRPRSGGCATPRAASGWPRPTRTPRTRRSALAGRGPRCARCCWPATASRAGSTTTGCSRTGQPCARWSASVARRPCWTSCARPRSPIRTVPAGPAPKPHDDQALAVVEFGAETT